MDTPQRGARRLMRRLMTRRTPPAAVCEIGAYPDGPFLVRGPFVLRDAAGEVVSVRRRTVALCRCGRSRRAPFCDGTHKAAGFVTSGEPRPASSRGDGVASPPAA